MKTRDNFNIAIATKQDTQYHAMEFIQFNMFLREWDVVVVLFVG